MLLMTVFPERLDARHTLRDHVRNLQHELLPIGRIIRPDTEFGIVVEQKDWEHQDASPAIVGQRLPSLCAERNCVEKATGPIRRDDFTLWPLPEDRVQVIWIVREAGDDLVVAPHDRAEDRPHLCFGPELWLLATPRLRAAIRSVGSTPG